MGQKSATTKLSQRDLDFYATPAFATRELLRYVPIQGHVLEPCVGKGDISQVLATDDRIVSITTNDFDTNIPNSHYYLDATLPSTWEYLTDPNRNITPSVPHYDWIISNLPFNQAHEILPLAFAHVKIGVAFLLRKSFTEPTFNRQDWLKEHEEYLAHIIYLPRISFTGDGKTDSTAVDIFVWTKEKVTGCKLHWVLKQKKSRQSRLAKS